MLSLYACDCILYLRVLTANIASFGKPDIGGELGNEVQRTVREAVNNQHTFGWKDHEED